MKKKVISIMYILFNFILLNSSVSYGASQSSDVASLRRRMYAISSDNGLFHAGSLVAGYIVYAAIVVSVVVLMIKGIKFITASPEGKADVKKELIPWAIGLIILFTMNIVLNVFQDWVSLHINNLAL